MIINLFESQEPELDALSAEELQEYLTLLRKRIAEHDLSEPEELASEAYDAWGDKREALEDLVDDVLDRLDELE